MAAALADARARDRLESCKLSILGSRPPTSIAYIITSMPARRRQDQAIFASDSKKIAPSCKHEDFRL